MLCVEFFPAILYFILLFFVPRSPRWLYANNMEVEAQQVLESIHENEQAKVEMETINKSISEKDQEKGGHRRAFSTGPALHPFGRSEFGHSATGHGHQRGLFLILYLQANWHRNRCRIFLSGVLLSSPQRSSLPWQPSFLDVSHGQKTFASIGITGIAISLLLCAYGFSQARYQLNASDIAALEASGVTGLSSLEGAVFESDVVFKNESRSSLAARNLPGMKEIFWRRPSR